MNLKFLTGILVFGFALVAVGLIGYNISTNLDFPGSGTDVNESSSSLGACQADAKACPDGTFVSRTGPNCEFAPCQSDEDPSQPIVSCCNQGDWYSCESQAEFDAGIAACGRGECAACQQKATTSTSQSSQGNVSGQGGAGGIVCTQDAAFCADGTVVSRDPANNCQFPTCPDGSRPESGISVQ